MVMQVTKARFVIQSDRADSGLDLEVQDQQTKKFQNHKVRFALPEDQDAQDDELEVAVMVKDQLTKKQFTNLMVHFVKFRMTSPLYSGEKYQNYAKAVDMDLDKYWAQHFFFHMKTPGIYCVFAHSRSNPHKIAGLMLAEIGLGPEKTVKLSGGTVVMGQNEGLLQRLVAQVRKTFPESTLTVRTTVQSGAVATLRRVKAKNLFE